MTILTRPLTTAERCRIHANKMDEEGWYTTANVLRLAAEEIERLSVELKSKP